MADQLSLFPTRDLPKEEKPTRQLETNSLDEMFAALQHFKHYNHEVILFHVTDLKLEEQLDLDDRPYKFVDMETNESIKLNPVEVRERYKEAFYKVRHELEIRCGRYDIDYVQADINQGFEGILLPYLFKRERLY